jgi:hypothetical protein
MTYEERLLAAMTLGAGRLGEWAVLHQVIQIAQCPVGSMTSSGFGSQFTV